MGNQTPQQLFERALEAIEWKATTDPFATNFEVELECAIGELATCLRAEFKAASMKVVFERFITLHKEHTQALLNYEDEAAANILEEMEALRSQMREF